MLARTTLVCLTLGVLGCSTASNPSTPDTSNLGSGGSGTAIKTGSGGTAPMQPTTPATNAGAGGSAPTTGTGGTTSTPRDAASPPAASTDSGTVRDSGSPAIDAGMDTDRCDIANADPSHMPQALALSGDLGTHDPSLISANGQYYLFQTGRGIPAKTSPDLHAWHNAGQVFAQNPAWIAQQVPGATDLWAPDISFFGGSYHLYYSASTFGSNHSCIGHATRDALDAGSWTDHGAVICSNAGSASDDWNAIDPNAVVDAGGTPWLAFGSFWSGLKLIQLDQTGARANNDLHDLASRPSNGGALEASYIVRRCGYYYLFTSFDTCCKGVNSTYKIMVGRSAMVTGPYADRDGKAMLQGGATLVLQGAGNWHGPGHNAVIFTSDAAYNVYHSYDANSNGNSFLRVSELVWDADGWPLSGGP